jgi:hypothetical protein
LTSSNPQLIYCQETISNDETFVTVKLTKCNPFAVSASQFGALPAPLSRQKALGAHHWRGR